MNANPRARPEGVFGSKLIKPLNATRFGLYKVYVLFLSETAYTGEQDDRYDQPEDGTKPET
jgi:hypothetical protein